MNVSTLKFRNVSVLFILFLLLTQAGFSQRVGLVLSGGGARGMAHIGVIKVLEENHIPIDYIAGTSAGAIVACMYAMGLSPNQMDSVVHTEDFFNWANGIIDQDNTYFFRKQEDNASWISLKFSLDSVFSTSIPTAIVNSVPYDYSLMESCAGPIAKADYNFDSLFVPFRCVAADIEDKKTIIFRSGDLATAVRASSAYPFYFKPVMFDGKLLYDGGMYNNFPVEVVLNDFQPDIIIGVNAAGTSAPTSESNIISQIRAMLTTPTLFSVVCENGILIEPNVDRFGLFDFTKISEIIDEGYHSTEKQLNRITFNIQRRIVPAELKTKRSTFRNSLPDVVIDSVSIEGVNSKQAEYVRAIIKPTPDDVPIKQLKLNYYKLVADPNVKSIYPFIRFNKQTGKFDLKLKINRDKDLTTQFGGNLSTKPVSEAFVGLQYNIWTKRAYLFSGNFYFGKLYTSGQFKVRMDAPGKHRYSLEAEATLNQYDFYRSSNQFFSEQKPSYILKSDYNFGLNFGVPVRNKGKFIASASYIRVSDNYYQTENFLSTDTADQTILKGPSMYMLFERSTLNRKQYANQGTFFSTKLQYIHINEYSIPGSTSINQTEKKDYHQWLQLKLTYENYFMRWGIFKFGIYGELVGTNMPFLANYTASVLNSPSFTPIQEAKTIFIPEYYAHNYGGAGLRNIIQIRSNIELRMEGYLFQPYKMFIADPEKQAVYGPAFSRRIYSGSIGTIFHSPLGPIGVFVNYFEGRKDSFSFLFHFGYFIFNKPALN